MAVETIVALVGAAKAVNEFLDAATQALTKISSGLRAFSQGGARQEVSDALEKLRANLHAAGELARIGEVYTLVHEQVMRLLWECERALGFLNEHEGEFGSRHPSYLGNWKVIEVIFESIDRNRDPVWSTLSDNILWYDIQDGARAKEMVLRFSSAFDGGNMAVTAKRPSDTATKLDSMVSELRQMEHLLSSTMHDKIFEALRTLGH